jgi:spore coat polysaccharide biosynthesis protein SpsF
MIVAIVQARMNSSRLPGKVLLPLGTGNLLSLLLKRISLSKTISKMIVATTAHPSDDSIENLVKDLGVDCYRGSEEDVLDRFYKASKTIPAPAYIVRLTADCPLMDALLIDEVVNQASAHDYDYYSNTLQPGFPDGMDIEVFKYDALVAAWQNAALPSEREHVTPYIWKNSTYLEGTLFTSGCHFPGSDRYSKVRLTVDEEKDYKVIQHLVGTLGETAGWKEYADHYLENPVIQFNNECHRNEGYIKSLVKDKSYKSDQ